MCRLAIMPFIPAGKEKESWELAQALSPYLTEKNQDGFGYMALGTNGLFGERWLDTEDAWTIPPAIPAKLKGLESILIDRRATYNSFGRITRRVYSMALHARMATCGYGLANVHPFISKNARIGVVHNGMITNADLIGLGASTCDSESIVTGYIKYDIADSLPSLRRLVDDMEGWYAVAAFSQDKANAWHLDVFRDARAALHAAYIPEADLTVLVTDPDHILGACDDLGWKAPTTIAVKNNVAIRFNPMTGVTQSTIKIEPNVLGPTKLTDYATGWSEYDAYSDVPPSYKEYSPTGTVVSDDGPELALTDAEEVKDLVSVINDPHGVLVRKGG